MIVRPRTLIASPQRMDTRPRWAQERPVRTLLCHGLGGGLAGILYSDRSLLPALFRVFHSDCGTLLGVQVCVYAARLNAFAGVFGLATSAIAVEEKPANTPISARAAKNCQTFCERPMNAVNTAIAQLERISIGLRP